MNLQKFWKWLNSISFTKDYMAWAKFAELQLSSTLLQPQRIFTPAQALSIRKDLLRLRLIKAIKNGDADGIYKHADKMVE